MMRRRDISTGMRLAMFRCLGAVVFLIGFVDQAFAVDLFPLKVSKDQRYLVTTREAPFLIHGDSPWSLISHLTAEEANHYLKTRRAQGFNTLLVNLLDDSYKELKDGTKPFLNGNDFSEPNPAYFDHAEKIIVQANREGFLILLTPVYLACCKDPEGWKDVLAENGDEKTRAFGEWLGKRFVKHDNIIWVAGGDRHPDTGSDRFPKGFRDEVNALVAGIKKSAPRHLFTAHTAHNSTALDKYPDDAWLTLNNVYTYYPEENKDPHVPVTALRAWQEQAGKPCFLIESAYENDHRVGATRQTIRRQAYWALTSGMCGHIYGNFPVWRFNNGWQDALRTSGAQDMKRVATFFEQFDWWKLKPDLEHKFLTRWQGDLGAGNYASAAIDEEGSVGVVYLPERRGIRVDLSSFRQNIVARWYDPATGEFSNAFNRQAGGKTVFDISPPAKKDLGLEEDYLLLVKPRNGPRP